MAHNSKADRIEDRLIQFAVGIVKFTGQLPQGFHGRHVATQLLRSGTAAAPAYVEARAAESYRDFVQKLMVSLKALNETETWLRIIQKSFDVDTDILGRLIDESEELSRILVASIQTARRNDGLR